MRPGPAARKTEECGPAAIHGATCVDDSVCPIGAFRHRCFPDHRYWNAMLVGIALATAGISPAPEKDCPTLLRVRLSHQGKVELRLVRIAATRYSLAHPPED